MAWSLLACDNKLHPMAWSLFACESTWDHTAWGNFPVSGIWPGAALHLKTRCILWFQEFACESTRPSVALGLGMAKTNPHEFNS